MTAPTSILLFAAGLGTRMGPLVADCPKPLVDVAGRTLLDRTLDLTHISAIKRRVVNVHYKAEMIRDHLRDSTVIISDETDMLRETGGGLRHALPLLGGGPIITMNTDAVWSGRNPIVEILNAWDPEMDALLLLLPMAKTHGHIGKGDFELCDTGRLTRGTKMIYSGLQIIRPAILDEVADSCFSMNVIWDKLIQRQSVFGCIYDGEWCDVGRPESIPLATRLLAQSADV
ncbi:MobA-like NTP transferase domain-containing protein [Cognatiyoonia koreensis]|uniref:MobA-like NTP transferase domain-containing protein n=1 Tax=Cognatiyoonia koreensis TaxID=364200 RepID=A0A1I0RPX1_9RHOB|nr:nucleotidyltransferase family protein [Cognatiyoonia koreensis]SEW43330.1 MobA-like NTP transferase domain-containing protein [Cognatiyoonia koreensis]